MSDIRARSRGTTAALLSGTAVAALALGSYVMRDGDEVELVSAAATGPVSQADQTIATPNTVVVLDVPVVVPGADEEATSAGGVVHSAGAAMSDPTSASSPSTTGRRTTVPSTTGVSRETVPRQPSTIPTAPTTTSTTSTTVPDATLTERPTFHTVGFPGVGSVVIARYGNEAIEFWSAAPEPGWSFSAETGLDDEVEIDFRRSGGDEEDDDEAELKIHLRYGSLVIDREYDDD